MRGNAMAGKSQKIPKRISTLTVMRGGDTKVKQTSGATLSEAGMNNHPYPVSEAKVWLEKKCRKISANQMLRNPNARFNNGDTLLHALLKYGHGEHQISHLKKLLQMEADPNMLDFEGQAPLMVACKSSQLEAARILANHHTTLLDIQDRTGNTALTHAVLSENRQVVEMILGASRSRHRYRMLIIRTSEGRTPEEVALSLCRSDLADIIGRERARVQQLFGNSKGPPKPEGPLVDPKIPEAEKLLSNQPGASEYNRKAEKQQQKPVAKKVFSPEPESSPQLPVRARQNGEREDNVAQMAHSVAKVANVHKARKRFLHLIGVFHQNK